MIIKLKNCPICDSKNISLYSGLIETDKIVYDVFCDEKYDTGEPCAYVAGYNTKEEAVTAWNERKNVYNYNI